MRFTVHLSFGWSVITAENYAAALVVAAQRFPGFVAVVAD